MDLLFGTFQSWSALLVRVTLGVIFFAHGAQKVFGWFGGYGLKGTTGYLTSLRIPLPIAYLVCFFEFLGGIGLFFGLLARPAALAVLIVMIGAIAKVHWPHGFFLNWSNEAGKGHGFEMNLALIGLALAVLARGAGALSIDRLIRPW